MKDLANAIWHVLRIEGKIVNKSVIENYLVKFDDYNEGIQEFCDTVGIRMIILMINSREEINKITVPFIFHNLVVTAVRGDYLEISDSDHGIQKLEFSQLGQLETSKVYKFETTPKFFKKSVKINNKYSFSYYSSYLFKYKKHLRQILFGLILATFLQLMPPFLTRIIIDKGIGNKDISFLNLIMLGLLMVHLGRIVSQGIRDWISFYIGNRISMSLMSDFVNRLMTSPLSFLERYSIGDTLQRINDNRRIENFLTNTFVNTIFMMFSLIVFNIILAFYHLTLFFIFFIGSLLFLTWTFYFLRVRKKVDIKMFSQSSDNQSLLIQMMEARQEIKLQGEEKERRWEWERNNILLYRSSSSIKKNDLIQSSGAAIINELKNIFLLYFSARLVIAGELSVGMMLSIQYIIGQANQPVQKAAKIVMDTQSALLSLVRLSEIHDNDVEAEQRSASIDTLPSDRTIIFQHVSFKYNRGAEMSLRDITFEIPGKKVTGIIGFSGGGKTTIIKLLAKLYQPTSGVIALGSTNLRFYNTRWWRSRCGFILQDSYLFHDTVINNITGLGNNVEMERVIQAVKLANIKEEIEKFSDGYQQRIGEGGTKVSPGQKQRLLIARLIYKNPDFVILDEATNALDPYNEDVVLENLLNFFKDKTVIMVTHRLKVLKHVDNLIIMDNGRVVEFGKPDELIKRNGTFTRMYNSENKESITK